MDILTIGYAVAVGIIAIIGLYKAYANDKKITKEELTDVIGKVEELWNDRNKTQ